MQRDRFSFVQAEVLRQSLGLTIEEFARRIGCTRQAYHIAIRRQTISPAMALRISRSLRVPLSDLEDSPNG